MSQFRIGQGFDIHRFCSGSQVKLCGISVPSDVSLEGHSDADVALHALADALLGAAALGDIGEHFPPHDPQWKGADSAQLLRKVMELIEAEGLRPVNCDLTIIGDRPKVAPFRKRMQAKLAGLLGLTDGCVSVKATTTEGLGSMGRGEGLAALAVVLMESINE
ncbi:MAG: 2-C-methyl-D-erythritol 2,4-cyclodiphosphate synthase [bacterium]|nr:2-C-methyl-D-erythritol 2,4-cyclodiphosphate synthase [bacterium]